MWGYLVSILECHKGVVWVVYIGGEVHCKGLLALNLANLLGGIMSGMPKKIMKDEGAMQCDSRRTMACMNSLSGWG